MTSTSAFAYEGGFLCVALATAAVLLSAVCVPRGPLARLLGFRPIAFVGLISYGMYLWYFPMFAVLTGANTGLSGWLLFLVRVGAVVALAAVSYYLVEVPLRTGRMLRIDARSLLGRARPALAACVGFVLLLGVVQVTAGSSGATAATSRVVALPASAPSAAPDASTGGPTRVLLVGDSTAVTLGRSLIDPPLMTAYDYDLDPQGTLGCGLAISAVVREHGVPTPTTAMCNVRTPTAAQWPAVLAGQVAEHRPDVVFVVAGRWEVFDRRATSGGAWQNITQPADAAYVRAQLERAVAVGGAAGAHVAIATAPCFSSGEQPNGKPWPEDDPARVTVYNSLVEQVAAAHPGRVSVIPLGAVVCPGGHVQMQLDGVTVRAPDGIHYPYYSFGDPDAADPDTVAETSSFGAWLAPQILPALLGRTVASSGGGVPLASGVR